MIRRIDRAPTFPPRRLGIAKRNGLLEPVVEDRPVPELALRYSNGFVTVEISHDAVDRYVEMHGDVPLPVWVDAQTGDRRTFDAKTRVRVVYDREARLREVTTRGRDGQFVRLTVLPRRGDADGPHGRGDDAFEEIADDERYESDGETPPEVMEEEDVEPQDAGDEDDAGAEENGDEPRADVAVEAGAVERADGVRGERETDQIAAGRRERTDEARDPALMSLEDRQAG